MTAKAAEKEAKAKGMDVTIDYKNAQADTSMINSICRQFVDDKVDMIVAIATPAAQGAATAVADTDIPVVFSAVTDPVAASLVENLEKPEGNISGTSDYTNLALTHIIPSGWEIYNERMVAPETESGAADGSGKSVSKYNYLDIRDDRVLTYFNLRRGETKVFTVRLQATYAGNFILPAVQCEAMYDVNVQARSKAGRTTVSR